MFKTKKEIIDGKFKCSCCNEWKLLKFFPKTSRNPFGIKYTCSKCEYQLYKNKEERKNTPTLIEDLEGEIWININVNPDYMISNRGRLKSLDRYCDKKDGSKVFAKGKLLAPSTDKDGYFLTSVNGLGSRLIHRIIALNFINNPNNLAQVNHIDGNKQNNNVENLEWVTLGENRRHDIIHLRKFKYPGVHKCGLKGYVSIFKHDKVEYRLGYIPNEEGIEELAEKYRLAVENFEKKGILPDGSKIENN